MVDQVQSDSKNDLNKEQLLEKTILKTNTKAKRKFEIL